MHIDESASLTPIAEGKTKIIAPVSGDPTRVALISKDDITAGDGAKHDIIEGKAALANQTTCNVFRLLKACHIPVAFEEQNGLTSFIALKCAMLPYEVVVRREAHGSYLKRALHREKGHIFPHLVLEFFLKTSGKKWKNHELVCDDPLMIHHPELKEIWLYNPKEPALVQIPAKAFLKLPEAEVFTNPEEEKLMEQMGVIARKTFLVLEKAWQLQGRKLVDFKVEFGISPSGELLLADVIDNDSWRVVDGAGNYMDKQVYRDGGDLNTVTAKYRQVAELTGQFDIPRQSLVLWRGSEKDDFEPFLEALCLWFKEAELVPFVIVRHTCSVHKEPYTAYKILQENLPEIPDTVLIAYIGRSNGAGPTLAANATIPVITVPAGYKDFPNDVWSSLRAPSNVPVMTVLEPANAVLAALQILAMRNPSVYATIRLEQEKRLTNY